MKHEPQESYTTLCSISLSHKPLMSFVTTLLLILILSASAFGSGSDKKAEYVDLRPGIQEAKANAAVVDSTGAMIMTGYTKDGTNDNIWTVKFKADISGVYKISDIPELYWRANYGHPSGGDDRGMALAIDSSDNVIVTGYVWNGTNNDIHTIKYCNNSDTGKCDGKKQGEAIWQHTYHPAGNRSAMGLAVAVDDLNNIYVGGNILNGSYDDYIIIKYKDSGPDTEGNPVWVSSYNGPAGHNDKLVSIAVGKDASGNYMVAVTGKSEASTGGAPAYRFDAFTKTYSGIDGSERKNGSNPIEWRYSSVKDSVGTKVLIGTDGHVIVTVSSGGSNQADIYTAKYNATTGSATPIWNNTESKVSGNNQEPSNMVLEKMSGDVIVTGYIRTGSYDDIYAVRYKGSNGNKVWPQDVVIDFNSGYDYSNSITLDAGGDVYIGGYTVDTSGNNDLLAVKLAGGSGAKLWQKTIDGPDGIVGKNSRTTGIGIGQDSMLLLGGWADLSSSGPADYDYYVVALDAGKINAPSGLEAKTDTDTSIKLTWTNNAGDAINGFIIEHKAGEQGSWTVVSPGSLSNPVSVTVGLDAQNKPITTFTDTNITTNTTYYYRVTAYSASNGVSNPSAEAHALTLKVTYQSPAWSYTNGGTGDRDDFAKGIAVGPDNHPVVTGYINRQISADILNPKYSNDYFTVKLNRADKSLMWSDIYNDGDGETDIATGVVVDNTNAAYVTGYSSLFPGSGENISSIFTMKYTDDYIQGAAPPSMKWEAQYNGPFLFKDFATTVATATDASNNIAVVGYGYNDGYKDDPDQTGYPVIYLVKYVANPVLADGETEAVEAWYGKQNRTGAPAVNVAFDYRKLPGRDGLEFGTGESYPSAVAFDHAGNVLITGYAKKKTGPGAYDYDIFTAKYCGSVTSGCGSGKIPGDMLWVKIYDGKNGSNQTLGKDDQGQSLAIDLFDNVYVTGSRINASGDTDIVTLKYQGSDGTLMSGWPVLYDGPAHGDDTGVSVKYDQANDTIVVGGTTHTSGEHSAPPLPCHGDHDFIVIRYDASGNEIKKNIHLRPDNDEVANDMVMDITGNVTLVGYTTDLEGSTGSSDAISVKFDYDMNLVAATIYDGKDTGGNSLQNDDEATAATVNFLGEIFIAGYTTKKTNSIDEADYLVYKMNTTPLQVCAPFTATPYYRKVDLVWTDTSTTEDQPRTKGIAGSGTTTTLQDNYQTSGNVWDANKYTGNYLLIVSVADTARNANIGQYRLINTNSAGRLITVASAFPVAIGAGDVYNIIYDPTVTTKNGEDGFFVERKIDDGSCSPTEASTKGWTLIKDVASHNNSVVKTVNYTDEGLTTGDKYCYRVRSHKAGQPDNRWVMRQIVLNAPQTPIIQSVTAINTTKIDITWQTRTSGDTGYKIYRCEGEPCVFPDPQTTPPNFTVAAPALTFSDTTVENNKKYGYKVFSYIADAVSGWTSDLSDPVYTTTPQAYTPSSVTATVQSNSKIKVTWSDTLNTDETGYRVRRCEGSNCTAFADNPAAGTPVSPANPLINPVGIAGANIFTFDDTTALKLNTLYRYEVCAYKTATNSWEKCSSPSPAGEATTTSVHPVMNTAAPVAGSSSDIAVTWTYAGGSETNFIIERCIGTTGSCTADNQFERVGIVAAGVTSWTDTSVCRNITYTYRVWAVNRGLSNDNSSTLVPGTWAYRAPLDFGVNFKANALAQINVDLIPGKMKADFSDLRVFDESTQKELQYVFGSKNAATATLVFQTGANNSLVLYYGNPNAALPFSGISDPNLAGYWPFKEGYNATPNKTADISGKGNTLDLMGFSAPSGIRVISGGNTMSFTGTGSYVTKSPINSIPSDKLDLSTNFTLMGWVYPKAAQLGGILDRGQEGKSAWELWYNADQTFSFTQNFGQTGVGTIKSTKSVPINQWTHITAVYTDKQVTLYVNGVAGGTTTFSNNPITSSSDWLEIGANRPGSTDKFFNGLIDEVRIYNTSMSADEVFGHFSARFGGSPSMDTGLVGYWPFEEIPGIPAQTVDGSGYGNDLTPTNSTIVAGGVISGEETLSFSGSGLYAITNTPTPVLDLNTNFTLMGWINPTGGGGILDRGNESGSAWELWYDSTNKKFGYAQNWRSNGSLPWESAYTANNTVPLSTWTHIAAVFTNKQVTLYINGVASGTPVTFTNNPATTGADWFEIGGNRPGGDEFFNGLVDEIRIYKSALSAAEVLAIATQATPITGTLQAEQSFSGTFSTAWPSDLKSTNTKQALSNDAPSPNTLTASVFSETQINLNWLNNSATAAEASGIKIMRCTGTSAGCSNYAQIGPDQLPNATSFSDKGLTPNNYYSYKVVAFKNVGCTSWSHDNSTVESNAVVDVKTAPVMPIGFAATAVVATECEDVRFTKNDGITLLAGQWAKKSTCGTSTPNIWMKVHDTIPASSTQTVYYYFGNPNAPSINSGSSTFDLFDEFNGSVIDSSKWTVVGSHYSQNGALISSGGSGGWDEGIYSVANFARPFIFEVDHFQTGGSYMMIGAKNTGANSSYTDYTNAIYPIYDGGGNRLQVYEDGNGRGDKKSGILTSTWQYYKLELLASGANYYYGTAPDAYTNIYSSTYSTTSPLKVGFPNHSQAFKLDNVRVRKGASVMPALTAGVREYGAWTVDGQTYKARIPVAIANTGTTALNDFQLQLPAIDTTPLLSDRVTLTWTDSTSTETGFTVERCSGTTDCSVANFVSTVSFDKNNSNAGISGQLQPQADAGLTVTFNDRTVAANTNYCYRVKPDLPTGETLYSGVVCKTTSLPKGMSGETLGATTSGSQVNLTWNDYTSNEDGFIIERCSSGPCNDVDNVCTNCDSGFPVTLGSHAGGTTAAPTTVSWSDNSTCTNSTYNYRVKSIKPWVADWPSDFSLSKSVPVQPALAPTAVIATRVSETQINLSWSYTSADESVLQIWRCTGDSTSCTADKYFQVGSDLAKGSAPYYNNNTFSDTGLNPNTIYTYQVRAAKYAATCPWTSVSALSTAHTETASTTAATPAAFNAIPANSTLVNLAFTDATVSGSGFKIQRCSGAGCSDFSDINNFDSSKLIQRSYKAYYSFNNTLNDSSGNNLNITLGAGTLAYEDGGLAMNTGTWFQSPTTDILNNDNHAIEFDIKIRATNGSWTKIFAYNAGGSDRSPGIWLRDQNVAGFHWRYDPSNSGVMTLGVTGDGGTPFTVGKWYHIRGVKTGTNFTVSVDGVQVVNTTVSSPKTAGNATLWFGGADVTMKNFSIESDNITYAKNNNANLTDDSVCPGNVYNYRVESTSNLTNDGGLGANWTNYIPLAIANFQPYFQTRITVPWNPKMKADFSDIRFYDATAKMVLPYWIESKTAGSSAVVWFKTLGNNNINLYYGNPNAVSASSGASVFDFFDDFDDTSNSLNTAVWSKSTSAADISVNGSGRGTLLLNSGGLATKAAIAASPQNMVFEMKNRWPSGMMGSTGLSCISIADSPYIQGSNAGTNAKVENRITYTAGVNPPTTATTVLKSIGADGTQAAYNLTGANYETSTFAAPTSVAANNDLIIGIEFQSSNSISFYSKNPDTYVDNSRTSPNMSGSWSKPAYMLLGYPYGTNSGTYDGWDMIVDWVRARKYAATEPSVTLGVEQPPTIGTSLTNANIWQWSKKAPVTITSFLANYPTKVTIPASIVAGRTVAQLNDLRFRDETAGVELPNWIENVMADGTALAWIKTGAVSTNVINLYYGNSAAIPNGNGSAVFEFFDDFVALDSSKWSATASSGYTMNSDGTITIKQGAVYSKAPVVQSTTDRIFEMKSKWLNLTGQYSGISIADVISVSGGNAGTNAVANLATNPGSSHALWAWAGNGSAASYNILNGQSTGYTPSSTAYVINGIDFRGATPLSFFVKDLNYSELNRTLSTGTWNKPTYLKLGYFTGSTAGTTDVDDVQVDWVRVRPYAATEPAGSVVVASSSLNTPSSSLTNAGTVEGGGSGVWSSGVPLSIANFQPNFATRMNIPATYTAGMKSDLSDLRFYDTVAGTELNYWVETKSINMGSFPTLSSDGGGVWNLRQPIVISNFQPNFLTRLNITSDLMADMKTDLADLRFYDSTANVEIPYWIQGISSSSPAKATILMMTGANNTITMYYGNSRATAVSNRNTVLGTGLVGYWPFEEPVNTTTGTTADVSGNGMNGTLTSAPTIVSGTKHGNGLSLNGTSNYVNVPAPAGSSLNISGSMSVEAWYKYDSSSSGFGRLVDKPTAGATGNLYSIGVDNTIPGQATVNFMVKDGTNISNNCSVTSPASITINNDWYHIVGSYDITTHRLSVFVNGVETFNTSCTLNSIGVSTNDLTIGQRQLAQYLKGTIDELRIYSRALNATDVASHYTSTIPVATTGGLQVAVNNPTVWLKTGANNSIMMYYGNPVANSVSNGNNVFDFFEDFDGTSIDSTKWNTSNGTGFSVSGGYMHGSSNLGRLTSNAVFAPGVIQEVRAKTSVLAPNGQMVAGFYLSATDGIGFLNHPNNSYYRKDSSWPNNGGIQVPFDWMLYTIAVKDAKTVNLQIYDMDVSNTFWNVGDQTKTTDFNNEPIVLGTRYDNNTFSGQLYTTLWDWVRVRKYAANEPVVTIGVTQAFSGFTNGNGQSWTTGAPLTFTSFQSNVPTSVVIPAATLGAMKTDLSDLRFFDAATKTELPYWVQSISGSPATAVVWLKTGASSSIYMYYGNPSATAVSNKNAVFGTRALSPATGMVGFWPFEETAGTISGQTADYSGSNKNGDLNGFASGNGVVAGGMFDNSLSLNGTSNYVTVTDTTNSPLDITGDLTVETWFKYTGSTLPNPTNFRIVTKHDTAGAQLYALFVANTTVSSAAYHPLRFYVSTGGSSPVAAYTADNAPQITDNNWHHLVGRYVASTKTASLIIDGVHNTAYDGIAASPVTIGTSDRPLVIGGAVNPTTEVPGNFFQGNLDEVRIYNRALTDAEIAARVSASPTIGTAFRVQPISTWASTYSNVITVITPDAGNVVVDPSFESGSTNWSSAVGTANNTSFDTTTAYTGTKSLKLAGVGVTLGLQQAVTVVPNMIYKLSGYLKNSFSTGAPKCDVVGGTLDSPGINVPTGTTDWTYKEELVTIPAGVASVNVRCFADGTTPTGSAWFDMIQLTSQTSNIVKNSDFDNGSASWTLGSSAATPDSTTSTNSSNSSLKISGTLAKNSQEIVSQPLTTLAPGMTYQLTGNMKADLNNGYAFCRLGVNTTWENPGSAGITIYHPSVILWNKQDNTIPENSDTTGTNGRLPLGSSAVSGDVRHVGGQSVMLDGSTYKMWYSGHDGINWRIYYATSPDGLTWTKQDTTIPAVSDTTGTNGRLPLGNSGTGDSVHASYLTVYKDGSTYKMWYSGQDATTMRIYYATSPDGLTWTKQDNTAPANSDSTSTNGRIPLGTATKGDSSQVRTGAGSVIKVGPTYKMWYSGYDGTYWRIYYATSPDGLAWTKLDNSPPSDSDTTSTNGRIPKGTAGKGDSGGAIYPNVIYDGSIYRMWYSGSNGTSWQIFYATSADGLVWTKWNNNLPGTSDVESTDHRIPIGSTGRGDNMHSFVPSVVYDGSSYKMWYMGNDSSGQTYYRIYHAKPVTNPGDNNDNQWHSFSIPIATKTFLTATDAANIRVVCGIARDTSGTDGQVDTAWFDTIQVAPANTPFGLTATRVSETQINLAWSDVISDETGYVIERCSGVGCGVNPANFAVLTTLAAGMVSYSDLGLVPNTFYSYRIKTYKTSACVWPSNYSVVATAQTSFASLAVPASPILTATVPDATHVNLSWTNTVTGQAGFEVERCTGAGCSFLCADAACSYPTTSKIKAVTSGTTFGDTTATGLASNKTYSYRIRAYNATDSNGKNAWNGAYSNVVTVTTTVGATAISTSTLSATVANTTQINLDWANSLSNESGYKIERCTGNNCTFSTVDSGFPMYVGPNTASYNDTSVCNGIVTPAPPGPPYSYRIYAANENGPSNSGGGSWSKRAKVNINNFQANLPIRMTIDRPAAMMSTYDDMRFIDTGTGVELPYFIEKPTSIAANGYPDRANVWIKTGTSNSIYLYYGNANATSADSVTGVFGSNLVGFWPFNETAGTVSGNIVDYSGNNLTATINNGALPYGVVTAGRYNNGLSLNGSSTYAAVADSSSLPANVPNSKLDITGSLTVETWYQYQTSAAWTRIISKPTISGAQPWDLFGIYLNDPAATANQQQPTFVVCNTNKWTAPTAPPIGQCNYSPVGLNLVPGNWYHIVGRWTANSTTKIGEIAIFINGVKYVEPDPNKQPSSFDIAASNEALGIGSRGVYGNNVKGVIDEVRLYNRALSDSEIISHYAAVIPTVAGFGTEESASASSSTVSPTIVNELFTDDSNFGLNATWTMEAGHMWREMNQTLTSSSPKYIDYSDSIRGQAKVSINSTTGNAAVNPLNSSALEFVTTVPNPVPDSNLTGITGPNYAMVYMNTPEVLKDEYDIQIDYSIPADGYIADSLPASPKTNSQYAKLRIDSPSDGFASNQFIIERAVAQDPNDSNKFKNCYRVSMTSGGAPAILTVVPTSDTSGTLRIVKIGNVVNFYKNPIGNSTWGTPLATLSNANHMPPTGVSILQYLGFGEQPGTKMRTLIDNIKMTRPNTNQYSYSWNYTPAASGYSNVVANITPTTPVAPTGVTATSVNDTQVTVSWTNPNTDQTGFKVWACTPVYPATTCTPDYTAVPFALSSATSFTASGLDPSTNYCFGVKAYKNALCRWDSDASVVLATSCDKSNAATPVLSASTTPSNPYRVRLDWVETSTDMSGYEIELQLRTGAWVKIATLITTDAAFIDKYYIDSTGIEPLKTYTYRIRNYRDISGHPRYYSPYSLPASATTGPFVQPNSCS